MPPEEPVLHYCCCCCAMQPSHTNRVQAGSSWMAGFRGQSPRRFFASDREMLHASSMSPYEDLTYVRVRNVLFTFFLHNFSLVKIIWEIWNSLDPIYTVGWGCGLICLNYFNCAFFGDTIRRKKKKKRKRNPPGGQGSGWTCRTHVQNFSVYLLKTAWTFGL